MVFVAGDVIELLERLQLHAVHPEAGEIKVLALDPFFQPREAAPLRDLGLHRRVGGEIAHVRLADHQIVPRGGLEFAPLARRRERDARAVEHDAGTFAAHRRQRIGVEDAALRVEHPERVARAVHWILGRKPAPEEVHELSDYATRHGLANLCRVLFNSNEFLFLD